MLSEIETPKKEKQPLGRWLKTKKGNNYMVVARIVPNKFSHGEVSKFKPATIIFAFKGKSQLTFSICHIFKGRISGGNRYDFSFKDKKDGSRAFYFKRIKTDGPRGVQVRHAVPFHLEGELSLLLKKNIQSSNALSLRIKKIVNQFIRANHPDWRKVFKYYPKDAFERMFLCVYPGYEIVSPSVYRFMPMVAEAKADLARGILKTNGSKTRARLVDSLNLTNLPMRKSAGELLFALKTVRRFYGLDKAARLIDVNSDVYACTTTCRPLIEKGNLAAAAKLNLTAFSHYTYKNFLEIFGITADPTRQAMVVPRLIEDTRRMITCLDGIPMGLNHSSLQELHDSLIPLVPRMPNRGQRKTEDHVFSCFIKSGELKKEIEKLNPKWEVVFPSSQEEMNQWSSQMHHCIASYSGSISRRNCDCVAILDKSTGKMLYNLEISAQRVFKEDSMHRGCSYAVAQAKGKYNKDPGVKEIELLAKAALSCGMQYTAYHRTLDTTRIPF